jgi:hypothetical protein
MMVAPGKLRVLQVVVCIGLAAPPTAPSVGCAQEALPGAAQMETDDLARSTALPHRGLQELPAPADSVERRPVGPGGAFFRSLIIPGWGQASLDEPTRGAFYFLMEAWSLYMVVKTQALLDAAERTEPLNEGLVAAREDQREDWIALAVFWSLFSGVDAWISAHLWRFEGEVIPPPDGSAGAAIRYSVPVTIF